MTKVAIDQPAPEFRLDDYRGEPISPKDFLGKKNIVLVFNRGFA